MYYSAKQLSEVTNAFAVLSVKVRSAGSSSSGGFTDRREKLSLSTPQVYQDLPGPVQVKALL